MKRGLAKRLDAALKAGGQPRRGPCVICCGDWMECPHTRREVDELLEARRLQKAQERIAHAG